MAISLLNAGPATVFAQESDLPYALVTPGEWGYEPSVQLTNFEVTSSPVYNSADATPWSATYYSEEYGNETLQAPGGADALSLDFGAFTATRPSLPGHLLDRAVNAVDVSSEMTLTLPPSNLGHARDFLVALSVTGTQSVTFSPASGENTLQWFGAQPPSAFASGSHLLSFSEVEQGVFCYAEGVLDPSAYETVSNKVSSISSLSTDSEYPSAACVYSLVGDVEAVLAMINGEESS